MNGPSYSYSLPDIIGAGKRALYQRLSLLHRRSPVSSLSYRSLVSFLPCRKVFSYEDEMDHLRRQSSFLTWRGWNGLTGANW